MTTTVRIPFIFGRVVATIILIWENSNLPTIWYSQFPSWL